MDVVADALSRVPTEGTSDSGEVLVVSTRLDTPNTLQLVQEQQKEDRDLANLIEFLEAKTLPTDPTEAKIVLSNAKKG